MAPKKQKTKCQQPNCKPKASKGQSTNHWVMSGMLRSLFIQFIAWMYALYFNNFSTTKQLKKRFSVPSGGLPCNQLKSQILQIFIGFPESLHHNVSAPLFVLSTSTLFTYLSEHPSICSLSFIKAPVSTPQVSHT